MQKRGQNKRGQVTLFIIIAVVIVAVVVLVFVMRKPAVPGEKKFVEPKSYIQDCAKTILKDAIGQMSNQGGYLEPSTFYPYFENKVGYLCYTDVSAAQAPYCSPQMAKALVKSELMTFQGDIENCTDYAISEIEKRGSEVTKGNISFDVNLTENSIDLMIRRNITVKNGETTAYENFDVEYPSALGSLASIAQDIVNGESSEENFYQEHLTEYFVKYSTNAKIQTPINEKGFTVYNLTSIATGESFLFAVKK